MGIRAALLYFAVCACAGAQVEPGTVLLSDDFTQDKSLNQNLWSVNTQAVSRLAAEEISGIQGLVTPQITFSRTGMRVTGVSAVKQFAGIKSNLHFTPPFTVQATVMGVVAHANPFALYLVSPATGQILRIAGNLNPNNKPGYGTSVVLKGKVR
jgi:hypothetical protein